MSGFWEYLVAREKLFQIEYWVLNWIIMLLLIQLVDFYKIVRTFYFL